MSWYTPRVLEWSRARVDQGISIEWSGIEFASRHLHGESPQWGLETTDWWHGATLATDTIEAPRGVLPLAERYGARTVTWTGDVDTYSTESLLEEMTALQTARGDRIRVWEGATGLYREARCRPVQAQIDPIGDRIAVYTVTVQLDDPLLQSVDDLVMDSSVTVTNRGTTASFPTVTVDGPTSSAPRVRFGSSWSIVSPRALRSGEQMVVDFRQSEYWVGGARVFPVLPAFPSLGVGESITISTTQGKGTVQGVSAWI